jgi:hypothetical protein
MSEDIKSGIVWSPRGLEQTIRHPYASKMLKTRDGYAEAFDEHGSLRWVIDGAILDVSRFAEGYIEQNPATYIKVIENRCGSQSPDFPNLIEEKVPGFSNVKLFVSPKI